MTAKEMFEELGYIERPENVSMCCAKSYIRRSDMSIIYFDYDKYINIDVIVSVDLLKAINQQCKELGWLDDMV